MRERIALALVLTGLLAFANGCRKEIDRAGFLAAINQSYAGRHECLWPAPIKLPAEIDPTKDDRVRDFDALTDAGLFMRETQEKQPALIGAKVVNKYNLADQGHSAWTPDPGKPGYGNFCFGHFNATAIDKATPNAPSNPTQYTVNYQYEVEGIPEWAHTPEASRAFPKVAADTSIQSASATLVKNGNGGWAVASAQ